MIISKTNETVRKGDNAVIISTKDLKSEKALFSPAELAYIRKLLREDNKLIEINRFSSRVFILITEKKSDPASSTEKVRITASSILSKLISAKIKSVKISGKDVSPELVLACAEGLALSNYSFIKYFTGKKQKEKSLNKISVHDNRIKVGQINEMNNLIKGVYFCRDLVNEPNSYLTATMLAKEAQKISKEAGIKITVFDKKKIESLRMGGLLAVNRGSIDPPAFSIMEWKPAGHKNKKPVVLVGKGIVFDTGGLSLKPTSDSMDYMKSDMAGAAAVIGSMYAIAKNKLPVHVIGLIPSTDNRIDGNAYAPGDIVKMFNGKTVEVLNTDAEGRMILADALSYADKYKPELIINIATLTGSAAMAIGKFGIVGMGNADQKCFKALKESGDNTYERVVEFPFWSEYSEQIKSDIADLKNVGGREAGAITAGKFLEEFTDKPFIHLDIAGTAFSKSSENYRGKGATGVCVRLMYDFIKNYNTI